MKVQGPHYPLRKTAQPLDDAGERELNVNDSGIQLAAALARGIHDATGNRSAIKMSSYGGGYSNRFRALTGHRPVATGSCGQVAACHALASGRRVRRPGELGSRSPRSASEDDIFFCPSVDLAAIRTGEFRCFDLGSGPECFFDCLTGRR